MNIDELLDESLKEFLGGGTVLSRSQDIALFKIVMEHGFSNEQYRDFLARRGVLLPSFPPDGPSAIRLY